MGISIGSSFKEEEGPDTQTLEGREVNVEKVCAKELTEKTLEAKEETGCAYRRGIIASSTFWDTAWLLLRSHCL